MGKIATSFGAAAIVGLLATLGVVGVALLVTGGIALSLAITTLTIKIISYALFKIVALPLLSWFMSLKIAVVLKAIRWALGFVFGKIGSRVVVTQ